MRRVPLVLSAATAAVGLVVAGAALPAHADPSPDDVVADLQGFLQFWTPASDPGSLVGTVVDSDTARAVLSRNDEIVTWINDHATAQQRFAALQSSLYGASPDAYDQSIVIGTALGSALGPLYIQGRQAGLLPLTSALINSENGSVSRFASGAVGAAKSTYRYPRPFLPSSTADGPDACAADPAQDNGSALYDLRIGQPWADDAGDLTIDRLPGQTDTTHEYTPTAPGSAGEPALDPDYAGLCSEGGFPSGHTTTAYEAGLTLATLLPELAPEILARASEQGNNRMVLGVHSPLDIMSGRLVGHITIAAAWSDPQFVQDSLLPAMAELRSYLEQACGGTIAACYAAGTPYQDDPYGGQAMPSGTSQIVTDRASAVSVYEERMTYRFPTSGPTGLPPEVPEGAENLLVTTFPTLTDAQRISVVAQTEIDSGAPLDLSGTGTPAWQRIDLAAATSATVQLAADGSATVVATGGTATVLPAPAPVPVPVPVLPATGADPGATPLVGAGALAVGVALLAASRRRSAASGRTRR